MGRVDVDAEGVGIPLQQCLCAITELVGMLGHVAGVDRQARLFVLEQFGGDVTHVLARNGFGQAACPRRDIAIGVAGTLAT
ncbi:hypothetical protein D3C78_1284580 [compost metagenome]